MNQLKVSNNKKAFTLIELLIVIGIIFVLWAMAIPPHHGHRRPSAIRKQCFSNQRVISGAVEMYNMDSAVMLDTALPGGDFCDVEEALIKGKYLKDYIVPPEEGCSYGFTDMGGNGYVFCKKHGNTESKDNEKPILPVYDESREKPISFEYKENKNKVIREREFRAMMRTIKELFSSPPFLIFLAIFVVCFTLSIGGKKKSPKA